MTVRIANGIKYSLGVIKYISCIQKQSYKSKADGTNIHVHIVILMVATVTLLTSLNTESKVATQ